MPTLEEIKATFAADRFATEVVGVEIQSAEPGHAVCALKLRPELMNAAGIPQGGAIFTLADFTFAVSANAYSDRISVSMQHDITYFAPARARRSWRSPAASAAAAPPAFTLWRSPTISAARWRI